MCFRWTKAETEELKRQLNLGINIYDVKIAGRTWDGIRRKAKRAKLIAPLRNPPITESEKVKLRELREKGFTVRQMSEFDMLGQPRRTVPAIQHAFSRMEFVNANRSRGAKNRKRWLNGERQTFDNFLRQNSKRFAAIQIAKKFGVTPETVTARQRQIKVRPSLAVNRQIPYFRKKIREANRVRSRKMLLAFDEYIVQKEKQLEKLISEMRQRKWALAPEEKACKTCGRVWYAHPNFYFHSETKRKGYTRRYFCRDCKLCVAKTIHQKKVAKYEKKYPQKLE